MKASKFFTVVMVVMMILPVMTVFGQDKEAYALFKDGTLTLYFDENKPESGAYEMRTKYEDGWGVVRDYIKEVVFDESFRDYRPTSCAWWFGWCSELTKIVGMKENLKTANVTDMNNMFSACSKLTSLDVSTLNTEKVENMYRMFYSLTSMTTITLQRANIVAVISTHLAI